MDKKISEMHLTEPLFNSATYTIDLHRETNPKFYSLVQEINLSLKDKPKDINTIIDSINLHAPTREGSMETVRQIRGQTQMNAVPIDDFFDLNDPAAKCLERSLLTQAVLASQDINSSLVAYTKHDPHIVLEIQKDGTKYTIDSNLQTKDKTIKTAIYPTSFYEKHFNYSQRNPYITPNVFSVL